MRARVAVSHGAGTTETVVTLQGSHPGLTSDLQPRTAAATSLWRTFQKGRHSPHSNTQSSVATASWPNQNEAFPPHTYKWQGQGPLRRCGSRAGEVVVAAAPAAAPAAATAPPAPPRTLGSEVRAPHSPAPRLPWSARPLLGLCSLSSQEAVWGTVALTPASLPACHLPCGAGWLCHSLTLSVSVIKCLAGVQAHSVSMLPFPSWTATDRCAKYKITHLRSHYTKGIQVHRMTRNGQ